MYIFRKKLGFAKRIFDSCIFECHANMSESNSFNYK
jgi:hypothetical protein